ncbi:hypothetical protein BRETT_003811 [Brettanomyces bruxellensis]|uniref:Kinesin motor domain-containing protein n=1 Tax=Dekkera bruxellensis TaxID=5007 RepID=A0A871RC24_DEKBR|nr:uncharacterized protein BRETT_003811 [Brettanomyces bruxellensis]QOU19660.1 hypothetical protein BRETT_003811 [Brettanomyces bruxellensis]
MSASEQISYYTRDRSRSASPFRPKLKTHQRCSSVKNDNIKVIARFRPGNSAKSVISYNADLQSVTIRADAGHQSIDFMYDRVFPESSKQQEIFDYSVRETTDDLTEGYNGTVLCYGQTGAGKSYTMMGELENPECRGLIPRIFERIFEIIQASPKTLEYTVGVSYLEIYNEYLRDLLDPQNNKHLAIRENNVDGVYVSHLETFYVANLADVYTILRQGSQNRTTGSTVMNSQSSRSHSIFQIKLTSKDLDGGVVKTGNLFLVDLAGSEKIDRTGATGQLLEEAKKINSSLSALGNVINSLTDGKSRHIPYRNSKLTRILQESLGGNSRTTLIINCSPAESNCLETLSTLRFGSRAKRITNSVHINSELSTNELKKRYLEQVKVNAESAKRMETMSKRISLLEEENGLLKEKIKRYKQIPGGRAGNEGSAIADSEGTDKLAVLGKELDKFDNQLDGIGEQNMKLRREIEAMQKVSKMKDSRIAELQTQLAAREALVNVNSSGFKNRLGSLKDRLSAIQSSMDHHMESVGAPISNKENVKVARHSAVGKPRGDGKPIGLNLRIVKPMRGRQVDE